MVTMLDEEIQHEVLDELLWDPRVEATDIGVSVDGGVVTLTGTVKSLSMSSAAEEATHRVKGVKAVANNLQVSPSSDFTRTDTDIAKAAAEALEWSSQVPHERIKVTVQDGWVTLDGDVDWHYQKDAAYRSVRGLMGVRGITDLIKVIAPEIQEQEVKARIEGALQRSAGLDAKKIQVEVRGGRVILTGHVHS